MSSTFVMSVSHGNRWLHFNSTDLGWGFLSTSKISRGENKQRKWEWWRANPVDIPWHSCVWVAQEWSELCEPCAQRSGAKELSSCSWLRNWLLVLQLPKKQTNKKKEGQNGSFKGLAACQNVQKFRGTGIVEMRKWKNCRVCFHCHNTL